MKSFCVAMRSCRPGSWLELRLRARPRRSSGCRHGRPTGTPGNEGQACETHRNVTLANALLDALSRVRRERHDPISICPISWESRMQPYTTTPPSRSLPRAAPTGRRPWRSRSEPPASTTRTRPSPGLSSAVRTRSCLKGLQGTDWAAKELQAAEIAQPIGSATRTFLRVDHKGLRSEWSCWIFLVGL